VSILKPLSDKSVAPPIAHHRTRYALMVARPEFQAADRGGRGAIQV
jgi:hypothetical protein